VIEVPDEEEADREFSRIRKLVQQEESSAAARAIDYMAWLGRAGLGLAGRGRAGQGRAFSFAEYENISNPRAAEKLSGRPD